MSIKSDLIKTLKNLTEVFFGKVYSNSEIKISDKSVGGKVEMISADGSLTVAPDGEYAMEDGFAFTVKDGVIESIVGQDAPAPEQASQETPAEDSTEQPTDETPSEDATEQPTDNAAIDELKTTITSLDERIAAIEKAIQQMNMQSESDAKATEKFTAIVAELNSNIQTLAKIPVQMAKTNNTPKQEESKQEKLADVARILGSINKK